MSLKHRNSIALILMLLAAVCWTLGQQLLHGATDTASEGMSPPSVSATATVETIHPSTVSPPQSDETFASEGESQGMTAEPSLPTGDLPEGKDSVQRGLGLFLVIGATAIAGAAIFISGPKKPLLGPDGVCLLLTAWAAAQQALQRMEYVIWVSTAVPSQLLSGFFTAFVLIFAVRELFGWLRARFRLSWCLVHRIAGRSAVPQMSLLVFVGWIVLSLAGFLYYLIRNVRDQTGLPALIFGFLAAAGFGIVCLWKYGADLAHFQKQLSNYQQGLPITVGNGIFSRTEAQLLDAQARHEEAIRTAVTSERFKVELISNVSHDLRTPLTSILGYSELLQRENLSPEGQEQLRCLHRKAGYMNELVESLFELTKVSSGVVESKKEKIDLVRLLEQTLGLFDDQLVQAGLTVRRSYGSDSIPVITDGARMHQVFANLLGNAIKYALTGTRIYLEVRETENSLLTRIMNTASYEMDFKPEDILQRFARGDKARSTKGSGLGLAIAQTYTESVGGAFRISVDGDQFSAMVELPKN